MALVFAGCGASLRTQTMLGEGDPAVRKYDQVHDDQTSSDQAGGGLVRRSGCPVCAW